MRIGIDARSVSRKMCGVSRVSSNLIQALARIDPANNYVVYKNFKLSILPKKAPNVIERYVDIPRYSAKDNIFFYKEILKDGLDVFHSLHSSFPLSWGPSFKTVLTIHDIIMAKYSCFFEHHGIIKKHMARLYFTWLIRHSIPKADVITTVSHFSKSELIKTFAVSENKIKVIYNGIDSSMFTPVKLAERSEKYKYIREKYAIEKPFILFVGNFKRYKNIKGALEGYSKYKAKYNADEAFVAIGNDENSINRVSNLARKYNIEKDVHFLGYIADNELSIFYSMAQFLIFPSIYEGFGMPPIEAMLCGTPVLASNAASVPEVVGSAALFVDPHDACDICEKINLILRDSELRKLLISKGLERARQFSWERTAEAYIEVYRKACG